MYDATAQLCPDSLFDMSLRVFAKDIHKIEPNIMQCLSNCIKRIILKYVTGYLSETRRQGLRNKKTLRALLSREVTKLDLRDSTTTDSILHGISENCVHLRELTLGGPYCHIKRKTLQNFIPKMKYLTFLCLKDVGNVTDKSISGLTDLEHLKHLNLKNCVNLTDESGKIIRQLKLEKLDMSHNYISDQWLNQLPNSPLNEHLIDLNLSYCYALSNRSLELLNWSKLKYVGLLGITGMAWNFRFSTLGKKQISPILVLPRHPHFEINAWLEMLELPQYNESFFKFIGVEELMYFCEGDIKQLGVRNSAHRASIVSSLVTFRDKYEHGKIESGFTAVIIDLYMYLLSMDCFAHEIGLLFQRDRSRHVCMRI